jgi:hypothetical protein
MLAKVREAGGATCWILREILDEKLVQGQVICLNK